MNESGPTGGTPLPRRARLAAALVAGVLAAAAQAQSIGLQGVFGDKALLLVDGGAPKAVAPGETYRGVKLVSAQKDQAVVEIDGRRHTLRVGETQASVGGGPAPSGGSRIVLHAGSGGHFFTQGLINGRAAEFIVDTGASSVAMSVATAERLGVDYRKGEAGRSSTANGVVPTWRVKLSSVKVGDVAVYDVDASVLPAEMPYVLLGNSFLSRFQMRRDNDQMVLERRF